MPTSSFRKAFVVPAEKADEFFEVMTRDVPPTLTKDFQSHLVRGEKAKEYLELIGKALENLEAE